MTTAHRARPSSDQLTPGGDRPAVRRRRATPAPHIRGIPEKLGSGNLPSNELKQQAEKLSPGDAELIVVGEKTLQKGFDRAITRTSSVIKRDFSAAIDKLSHELRQGLES